MEKLTYDELLYINGGSEETYNNGYALGHSIKTAIVDAWDWVRGFFDGFKKG